MKIIDDLLSTTKQEAVVKDIRLGAFQTAALTDDCGLTLMRGAALSLTQTAFWLRRERTKRKLSSGTSPL